MKRNKPLLLAVDAGGSSLKGSLCFQDALTGPRLTVPIQSDWPADQIEGAYEALARLARETAVRLEGFVSEVVLCTPGPFAYEAGYSRMTHKFASVRGVPMRPWFSDVLGNVPVSFLHDSSAYILGAVSPADRAAHRSICCVVLGTGLGFASMVDGRVLVNAEGGPGISLYAAPFRNGKAEDFVSRRAVENAYRRLSGKESSDLSVKDIAGLARKHDPAAAGAFEELGTALGQVLAGLYRKHRFSLLLLGGAISKSCELYEPSLERVLKEEILSENRKDAPENDEKKASGNDLSPVPVIRPVDKIDDAPLLGCIAYAKRKGDASWRAVV